MGLLPLTLLLLSPLLAHSALYSTFASSVYGQSSFTSNQPGLGPALLNGPRGVVFSPDEEDLYAVDSNNNRVIMFPQNRVYGQLGSFTTNTINRGGLSANSLRFPSDAAVSALTGALLISDTGNHRVLYYPAGSTTATRVYGQPDFVSGTVMLPVSANSLNRPAGVAFDEFDNVYIADFLNHRVLFYEGTNTTASRVYGQNGRFDTNTQGLGNDSFYGPYAVSVLGNRLIISDTGNHRLLFYRNSLLERIQGNGVPGVSRTLLNGPYHALLDSIGGALVSDAGNHRILYFLPDSDQALIVFGQAGSFTSNTNNLGGTSQTSFSLPSGISVARRRGLLALADLGNNRILLFPIINTINANQTVLFPDGGLVAPNSTLEVLGDLNVVGDMQVEQSGTVLFNSSNSVNVTEELRIESNTTLVLSEGITQFPVTVMRYRSVVNTFSQVVEPAAGDGCQLTQTYTLSALIVMKECGGTAPTSGGGSSSTSGGSGTSGTSGTEPSSSTALIVGVTLACILTGTAVAIGIVLYFRWRRNQFTTATNQRLKDNSLNDLRPNPAFGAV